MTTTDDVIAEQIAADLTSSMADPQAAPKAAAPKTASIKILHKGTEVKIVPKSKTGGRAKFVKVEDKTIEKKLAEIDLADTSGDAGARDDADLDIDAALTSSKFDADADADATKEAGSAAIPLGPMTSASFEQAFGDLAGDVDAGADVAAAPGAVAPAATGGEFSQAVDPAAAGGGLMRDEDLPADVKHFLGLYNSVVERYLKSAEKMSEPKRAEASSVVATMLSKLENLLLGVVGLPE